VRTDHVFAAHRSPVMRDASAPGGDHHRASIDSGAPMTTRFTIAHRWFARTGPHDPPQTTALKAGGEDGRGGIGAMAHQQEQAAPGSQPVFGPLPKALLFGTSTPRRA
jgi:hypothetical protein